MHLDRKLNYTQIQSSIEYNAPSTCSKNANNKGTYTITASRVTTYIKFGALQYFYYKSVHVTYTNKYNIFTHFKFSQSKIQLQIGTNVNTKNLTKFPMITEQIHRAKPTSNN